MILPVLKSAVSFFNNITSQFPVLSTHYHIGDTYKSIRNDWVKKNVEKYITQEKINFSM